MSLHVLSLFLMSFRNEDSIHDEKVVGAGVDLRFCIYLCLGGGWDVSQFGDSLEGLADISQTAGPHGFRLGRTGDF